MSVKIRLTRMGKKKQPSYRVVVMDSRKPRDGKYIEQIGRYDPRQDPSLVEIDNDRAVDWLTKGAQPTERTRKLLEVSGAWTQFRIARGDILTIDEAPEPAAAAAPAAAAPAEPPAPVVLEEIQAEGAAEGLAESETPASDEEAAPSTVADAVIEEDTTEGSEET
jgi:small subunit ribosomal protein S16